MLYYRGVLSIAWCIQDPELLISCGKDSRILCWNPAATQPVNTKFRLMLNMLKLQSPKQNNRQKICMQKKHSEQINKVSVCKNETWSVSETCSLLSNWRNVLLLSKWVITKQTRAKLITIASNCLPGSQSMSVSNSVQ